MYITTRYAHGVKNTHGCACFGVLIRAPRWEAITIVADTVYHVHIRGTQRQFFENICSEDDLRSRIFETFVVKFPACLPLLGFSNI